MKRITEVELYGALDTLNTLLREPTNAGEIGSYYLYKQPPGWQLQRTMNKSGGFEEITQGYLPKRLMYERIWGMIAGIRIVNTE